jgi:hypothetical protein
MVAEEDDVSPKSIAIASQKSIGTARDRGRGRLSYSPKRSGVRSGRAPLGKRRLESKASKRIVPEGRTL